MESKNPDSSYYTRVIDLTSKAQREKSHERAKDQFASPDPDLPEATVETLPDSVQQALRATGWEDLMPVQKQAIPYMLDGRDLIVQSRTGSGKTGAFLLPLFELLDASRREAQALVLTPTRELARQVHEEFERMKAATPETFDLDAALVYGGVGYGPQIKALKGGAQVIIGTPGRILDHLDRRNVSLDTLRVFILDEADEMLSMGFYPSMRKIKSFLPRERQSYMFSATMPPKVRMLGNEFLDEPSFLGLSTGHVSVDTIEHRYYRVSPMEKDRALIRLIEMENPDSAIIFSNTKREVEYLTKFLKNYGHHASEISGDLSQKDRERAMDRIRDGKLRFLVATDVAARGIDVTDLSHVFQYDVPEDMESYIHRTGRTARAGKAGIAIALATVDDEFRIKDIARRYDIEIEKTELPTEEEVASRVAQRMVIVLEERMRDKSNLERERLKRFVPVVQELVREEPELLAMLIDEIYHERMHQAPQQPSDAEASSGDEQEAQDRSDKRGKGRSRGGRRR